jgi:uncharacterized protein YbjT (DUF2867 family)
VILVTGASGAVGSGLVERLIADGERPLVAGRRPERLTRRWPELDAVELDVLRPSTVGEALRGVDTAYYLVHSMEPGAGSFAERDRRGAATFARAAREAGASRIIYLGGLGREDQSLSEHLDSRHEIGRVLAGDGPPLLEFRAAMVIGRDSASYRMLADLVTRLPVMVVPTWVDTPSQPIAARDVVAYLSAGRRIALRSEHTVVEIGGADVVTYREMLHAFARMTNRRRTIVGVPFLTPRLSSLWCAITTSVPQDVARPLVDGMTHPMVVGDDAAVCADPIRPYAALYVGGMGSREQNFYNALVQRYGYEDAAREVQELYLDGKKEEAAAALPEALIDEVSLCGPRDRIKERLERYREAGVGTLMLTPMAWTAESRAEMMRTVADLL